MPIKVRSGGAWVQVAGDGADGSDGIPAGGIIIWSGASNAIPSGWVLCNGSNSTPDLRNRFVIGAGSGYAVNATGGSATKTLGTANLPSHTHTYTKATHPSGSGPEQNQSGGPEDRTNFGDTGTTSGASVSMDHNHTLPANTGSTGSGQSHENRPPYYALCYIMKT